MRRVIIEDALDPPYLERFHHGRFLRQQLAEGSFDLAVEIVLRLIPDLDFDRAAVDELHFFHARQLDLRQLVHLQCRYAAVRQTQRQRMVGFAVQREKRFGAEPGLAQNSDVIQVEADDRQRGVNEARQQHAAALAGPHHTVGGIHDFQQVQIGENVERIMAWPPRRDVERFGRAVQVVDLGIPGFLHLLTHGGSQPIRTDEHGPRCNAKPPLQRPLGQPEQRAGVARQALGLEGIEPRPDFFDGVGYGKPQHLVGFLRGEAYAGRGYEMTLRFHEEGAAKRPLDALCQGQ